MDKDEQIAQMLPVIKQFYVDDIPKRKLYFYSDDVVEEGVIIPAQLAANRCIKVTIEYSDLPEKENNGS